MTKVQMSRQKACILIYCVCMDVTRDSNIENNTTCVALFISRHNGCGYGVALNCFCGAVSSPLALSHGIFLGHDDFL